MSEAVLVINAGSSSLKFSVLGADPPEHTRVLRGQIEGIGATPRLVAKDASDDVIADEDVVATRPGDAHEQALAHLGDWLPPHLKGVDVIGVGHRVVHGGPHVSAPLLVDDDVLDFLRCFEPLAPLHQPYNLAAIRAVRATRPDLPQVACFDTAFHRGHPRVCDRFGLPDRLYREGVRRYGFHGLSYEYIARTLPTVAPEIADGRVVIAHLGSGASMCAIRNGRSVDSSMGFTAVDGLPMGTRCGSLDPGVVIHFLRTGMTLDEVETLLYRESGLLGISGVSNDMRDLLASDEPLAAEAVDYFAHRIARELGALTATIGGLDALVFTAGIGEHSPVVREKVAARSRWLGIRLDEAANRVNATRISARGTTPSVWVVPTNEERMIAMHTLTTLAASVGAVAL